MGSASPARPWVVGHRGAALRAPENTAAGIRAGIDAGADAIEVDVRLAADGRVVVLHDATLDRTTDGRGPVDERAWAELARLDAGSWFSRRFRGEPLLDLDAALALARGRVPLFVEIKAGDPAGPGALRRADRLLLDGVLAALRRTGGLADVVLSSFHWPVLAAAAAAAPSARLALTVGPRSLEDPVEAANRIGATALHANRRLCSRSFVARAHAAGLEVLAFVVDREREVERLLAAGVDGVFTDDPGRVAPLVARLRPGRRPRLAPGGAAKPAASGPSGSLRSALLRWYRRRRRDLPWRRVRDPYAVWVSEVMLQQTRVAAVIPFYDRFLEAFPGVAALASAPEEAVLAAWSGLGYYRRARALREGARAVMERFGGEVPADPAALRSLPGIGRYTAGAIASIAFGLEEPVLDGNVRRVLSRILARRGRGTSGERELWEAAGELVRGPDPGGLNQALMELGATVCLPRAPRCGLCPAAGACAGRATGRPGDFPAPRPRKPPVEARVAVGVVERRGLVLLERRGSGGPFRGEWDLPAVEIAPGENAVERLRAALESRHGVAARPGADPVLVRHAILDRRLAIEAFRCRPAPGPPTGAAVSRWVRAAEIDGIAVSGATRKILRATDQRRSQGGTHRSSGAARRRSVSGSGSSGRSNR